MTNFAKLRLKLRWTPNICIEMTSEMSTRTCYTNLKFYFFYVRSLSLRLDTNNNTPFTLPDHSVAHMLADI